ncbi:MAG: hypothetical protein E5X48_22550 [Mesorhizobium sp.]|nr:MAG: hypothetical protein E5X48_22550 [Mesorhizobium sp.]
MFLRNSGRRTVTRFSWNCSKLDGRRLAVPECPLGKALPTVDHVSVIETSDCLGINRRFHRSSRHAPLTALQETEMTYRDDANAGRQGEGISRRWPLERLSRTKMLLASPLCLRA